jgi:hypothetical protein
MRGWMSIKVNRGETPRVKGTREQAWEARKRASLRICETSLRRSEGSVFGLCELK